MTVTPCLCHSHKSAHPFLEQAMFFNKDRDDPQFLFNIVIITQFPNQFGRETLPLALWLVSPALWPHSCAASPLLSPTSQSTPASLTSPLPHPLSHSWQTPQLVRPPSVWPWTAHLSLSGEWKPTKEMVRGTLRPRWVETCPSLAWLCPCVACWGAAAPPPICLPACHRNATRLPEPVAASSPSVRTRPVRLHPDGLPSEWDKNRCASNTMWNYWRKEKAWVYNM